VLQRIVELLLICLQHLWALLLRAECLKVTIGARLRNVDLLPHRLHPSIAILGVHFRLRTDRGWDRRG
jgi:hypothetical protein